ncbi:MAG: DnaJ domain-containing protein [Myxococcales bacterium]|nr:DnaJ domain-containing protein [Myxococcales bacterium]
MAYRDYYSVLGVERGASHEDIQRAYKKLARKYHPDISKEPDAEDRFKELNNAYEVLKDEEKRKLYDRYGEDWKAVSEGRAPRASYEDVRSDFGQAGVHVEDLGDLESIFGSMFGGQPFGQAGGGRVRWSTGGMGGMGGGGGFGGQRQWKTRGSDYEAEIVLSLEDAFHGGERTLRFENPATREAQEHRVRIPPGGQDGSRIRLKGRGAPGQGGGPAGDLWVTLRLRPDPRFRLEGRDLHTTVWLAPWEASLGAKVPLQTLDGEVTVTVPPGSSSGRRIRLRGRGYSSPKGGRGDLYAEVEIAVPKHLTDEERRLMQALRDASDFEARDAGHRAGERPAVAHDERESPAGGGAS